MRRHTQRRPEEHAPDAATFYSSVALASDYTAAAASSRLQAGLAQRCLELLGSPLPSLLLDLGCGSGLSTGPLLEAQHAVLGLDVAAAMLRLAPPSLHRLQADLASRLPLRAAAFDGAVSVSALQWLATGPGAAQRCHAFFTSLAAALQPGAPLAFQVYPGSAEEAVVLRTSCAAAGFAAALLLSDRAGCSPARKLFLVARKASTPTPPAALTCALAWPWRAACAEAWDAGRSAGEQCSDDHVRYRRRMMRLLRRAVDLHADASVEDQATAHSAAVTALGQLSPASWCSAHRIACVATLPTAAAAAAAASDVFSRAGWATQTRAVQPAAPSLRFRGVKRPASQPEAERRDRLRAAAGATPDASLAVLSSTRVGCAGLLLSPDAVAHGALSLVFSASDAGAVPDGALAAGLSLQLVTAVNAVSNSPAVTIDLALADGAWKVLLLAGGPWTVAECIAASQACAFLDVG